jgi:hypothetical protein
LGLLWPQDLGRQRCRNHNKIAHPVCLSKTERDTDVGTARRHFQNDFRRALQLMRLWKTTSAYLSQLFLVLLRQPARAGARRLVKKCDGNLSF